MSHNVVSSTRHITDANRPSNIPSNILSLRPHLLTHCLLNYYAAGSSRSIVLLVVVIIVQSAKMTTRLSPRCSRDGAGGRSGLCTVPTGLSRTAPPSPAPTMQRVRLPPSSISSRARNNNVVMQQRPVLYVCRGPWSYWL